MRALRDMNLPKFIFDDVPLFLGLIADLFPELDCPRVHYPDFNDAVDHVIQEQSYVHLPEQVLLFLILELLSRKRSTYLEENNSKLTLKIFTKY